jgi:hypothetical protein
MSLLRGVAVVVAHANKLTLGRQEKRRKEFVVGWLNEHYDCVEPMIDFMLLREAAGGTSGPVALARVYLAQNPEKTDQDILFQSDLDD